MSVVWHDVTLPMCEGMTVWPDDPALEFAALNRITRGDNCNTSLVTFTTHTGTHIDAPWHFVEYGKKIGDIAPALFFGEALLIDLPDVDMIRAEHLGSAPLPPRVLFKTRNSEFVDDGVFKRDYAAIDIDAAERLVKDDVRLVGVDYLSVAPYKQRGQETHHRLLRKDVVVVEGLRLGGLPAGWYLFTVLPLLLTQADGAPCRAFVGYEEGIA